MNIEHLAIHYYLVIVLSEYKEIITTIIMIKLGLILVSLYDDKIIQQYPAKKNI